MRGTGCVLIALCLFRLPPSERPHQLLALIPYRYSLPSVIGSKNLSRNVVKKLIMGDKKIMLRSTNIGPVSFIFSVAKYFDFYRIFR